MTTVHETWDIGTMQMMKVPGGNGGDVVVGGDDDGDQCKGDGDDDVSV